MRFTKMHGLGNDYIYVNCFEEKIADYPALARVVSDRHYGIGADGLILIDRSQKADVRMRIFNADGSEAEMCGNGIRCVAKYTYDHKLVRPGPEITIPCGCRFPFSLNIETGRGVLKVGLQTGANGKADKVCVNMGKPSLEAEKIPVKLKGPNVIDNPIIVDGHELKMTCVSMGNPHAVFFTNNVDNVELEDIGPMIENNSLFPNRTNVHFVETQSRSEFKMRTWERGSGITLACGTGACACCVAANLMGMCQRACTAHLPGGTLELNWAEQDNSVYMTGTATEVFEGTFIWPEVN